MFNEVIFYKINSIYEQLDFVMREILKQDFKNVLISIPNNQDIDKIMRYLNERKFKYSFNISSKAPTIVIGNGKNNHNEDVIFYLLYDFIQDKQKFLESLTKTKKNIIMFKDLTKEDKIYIESRNYQIDYRESEFLKEFLSFQVETEAENEGETTGSDNNIHINRMHIMNKEIRNKFLETFLVAEEDINIISPWMNTSVVDNKLIEMMENALKRNIKIKIVYGIGENDDERNKRSEKVASVLIDKFKIYGDLFKIQKSNIHYKLLLCDEKFAIAGSYNFLSYLGDYDGSDNRIEGADYIVDKQYIIEKRNIFFNF
jgi:phosphatidylserine/phosphatidylglycerophosphate/cardiolipin synthase-like enzyme